MTATVKIARLAALVEYGKLCVCRAARLATGGRVLHYANPRDHFALVYPQAVPPPPDMTAAIRAHRAGHHATAVTTVTANGVPNPPDLGSAIRARRSAQTALKHRK